MKLSRHGKNIAWEETVSQIFDLWTSFKFVLKTGNFYCIFLNIFF